MRYAIFLFSFLISNGLLSQERQQVYFEGGNICDTTPFKLVFFDEFDGTELDTEKWLRYYPYAKDGSDQCSFCRTHNGPENYEGQVFKDENVRVSNGMLYLDVKQEDASWFEFDKKYTSGMIYSTQQFNTYAKYEVRCKIVAGTGYWPAFWVFGWSTEIDVFEFYERSRRFECSVHKWGNETKQFHKMVKPRKDMSRDFHVYAVEYDKYFVSFFLDGVKKASMPRYLDLKGKPVTSCDIPAGMYYENPEFPTDGNPVNVIANIALYNKDTQKLKVEPKTMEIDYIRVYQRNPADPLGF